MKREKKAWRIILIFFAVMLFFTVLSRAADSVTIPKVKVETSKSGTLNFTLEGEGSIAAEKEELIFLPEEYKPVSLAEVGTEVKEGDVLAVFDTEALKEKKETCEAELKKLELSLEQETLSGEPAAQTPEMDAAQRTVAQINEELDAVSGELERRNADYREKSESQDLSEEKKQELEAGIQECEGKKEALEQSLREAQNALETARMNDANTETNNQRQQRLAQLAEQSIQIDIEQKKKEIEKLEKSIRDGGKVFSTVGGTITEVTAAVGVTTSGQEYFKIGSGNGELAARMDKETAAGLKEKDQIRVTLLDGKDEVKGTITSIQDASNIREEQENREGQENREEQGALVEIRAKLKENRFGIGDRVSFQVARESKEYDTLIPLHALREDSEGNYVLIMEEENSILGKEMTASRVPVKILEKNESSAAVESALMKDNEIIVSSNKTIKAGDRVRKE